MLGLPGLPRLLATVPCGAAMHPACRAMDAAVLVLDAGAARYQTDGVGAIDMEILQARVAAVHTADQDADSERAATGELPSAPLLLTPNPTASSCKSQGDGV